MYLHQIISIVIITALTAVQIRVSQWIHTTPECIDHITNRLFICTIVMILLIPWLNIRWYMMWNDFLSLAAPNIRRYTTRRSRVMIIYV